MIDDKNVFIMMTFKDNPMGKFNINDEEYYHNLARDVLLKNPLNNPYYIKFSSVIEQPNLRHIFIGLNITKCNYRLGKYQSICVIS